MSQEKQESIVSSKEKVSFFLVNIANIPIMTLIGYFLLIFYVEVALIPAEVVGLIFLVSRIIDGINDPITGYFIDHLPKTKMGRFRSYLIIGAVLCSINYAIMWIGPTLVTNVTAKKVIVWISYLIFGFTFDLMDIPLNSMIPVMSDKDSDRNSLSNIKGAAYIIGAIIFAGAGLFLVDLFATDRLGYTVLILFAAAFVMIFSIIGTLGIKERIEPVREEKYTLKEVVKILGAWPVIITFLDLLIWGIGAGLGNAIMIFFFKYALGRPDLFNLSAVSLIVGVLIGVAIAPAIIRRIGKKQTKVLAAFPSIISAVILFFTPNYNAITFVIIPLYCSWGLGLQQLLNYNIAADNMDYVEYRHGFRSEGALASLSSFISKAAGGIGAAIAAFALPLIGFIENNPVQSLVTIQGFYWLGYAIPAFCSVISLIIWSFYPLTENVRLQMMKDLINKRQAFKIQKE